MQGKNKTILENAGLSRLRRNNDIKKSANQKKKVSILDR